MPPEKLHWKHLYSEVVTSGLCTGCAGCVIACPHDVLGYRDDEGIYRPFQIETATVPTTAATARRAARRAPGRARAFGRGSPRSTSSCSVGPAPTRSRRASTRTSCSPGPPIPVLAEIGQDGGLVSALLVYALEHDMIDAALVSYLEGDGTSWKAIPGVARTREDVIASAGSRYTYSANTMAYADAIESGAERIALVGMSCQSSVPPVMKQRKAGKVARRLSLNIGLLCSKTFDDAIFEELFEAKYGLKKSEMRKMNIKGVFQIWMKNGDYHEVPLKECHAWTREGCKMCPDFAAEHADISTGGIGEFNDWTLTIVRTDVGRELMDGMMRDGWIETRPGDDDPGAIALMHKLSIKSRKRWPGVRDRRAPAAAGPPDTRFVAVVRIVALVPDLMDRSRISSAFPNVIFAREPGACAEADIVVVDLARHEPDLDAARAAAPEARIVAFGPHVEREQLERARDHGADVVFARSRFFNDPASALNV